LDIRLTRDHVPVVYHYVYLDDASPLSGPIFDYTAQQLGDAASPIPTLYEVLQTFAGRIGLEIEIKGPEPESAERVAAVLGDFGDAWGAMEITSYEPALLRDIQARCPDIAADLLFPRSESWMKPDVVAHFALQRARLAHARAVHLHPTQLSAEVVATIRAQGVEVHAWDVNDAAALELVKATGIPRMCTDQLPLALAFRRRVHGR
jgi:glycerophosphoryl diester phosphodiesterase